MRNDFPIVYKPEVNSTNFRFSPVGVFDDSLPSWFAKWTVSEKLLANVKELQELFGCEIIHEFVSRLFGDTIFLGVIECNRRTLRESNRHWLVLGNKSRTFAQQSLDTFSNGCVGEFLFIPQPTLADIGTFFEMNLVNRFFLTLGGLRDSPPHFGGDFFSKGPSEIDNRMINSRESVEKQWLDSEIIHTRGNCDYLILNPDGRVGYLPIENERKIETYSDDFEGAIFRWINENASSHNPNGNCVKKHGEGG